MLQRLLHYHHKLSVVGIDRCYKAARIRVQKKRFIQSMRRAIQQGTTATQWKDIARFEPPDSNLLFFESYSLDTTQLISLADQHANNSFSLLGSTTERYDVLPWYTDVRLQQLHDDADCNFDRSSFYADITIASGSDDQLVKDIKVPWELARFSWAPLLSMAYQTTQNEIYIDALKRHITSWLDACPFLHGIHWMNPMEVAIRAVNWIIAYQQMHEVLQQDASFHNRLICSLWDHMRFIAHNWEWYDGRTNNHYLSNLVGYAYLCWFFQKMPGIQKKWNYCFQELQSELIWQVFDEGLSYEGSTAYHGFITELFLHGFFIAQQMGETIAPKQIDKLARMMQCYEHSKTITIGDDDSGSLLHPLLRNHKQLFSCLSDTPITKKSTGVSHYPLFGISIHNTDEWNVSLRHLAYQKHQPSAHFHEDMASITISYNGIPIVIDPGSYVYTASSYWRNFFRSIAQHSTVYPASRPMISSHDLFAISLPETAVQIDEKDTLHTSHPYFGYPISRSVSCSETVLTITDDISHAHEPMSAQFIVAPDIDLHQKHGGWDMVHKGAIIMQVTSSVPFQKVPAWMAPRYGIKKRTWMLKAVVASDTERITTHFYPK